MPPGGPLLYLGFALYYVPFAAAGIAASFVVARALFRRNRQEPLELAWRLVVAEFLAFYAALGAGILTGAWLSIYAAILVLGTAANGLLVFKDVAAAPRWAYAGLTAAVFLGTLFGLAAAHLMYPLF